MLAKTGPLHFPIIKILRAGVSDLSRLFFFLVTLPVTLGETQVPTGVLAARLCARSVRSGMDDDLALALRLQEEEEQSRHPPAPAGEEDEAYARQLQREEEEARAGDGSDDAALAERLQTEEAETSLAEPI